MKSTILALITLLMTLPTMAQTVSFSGGKLVKEKVSDSQINYQLKLKSGLSLNLTDSKAKIKVDANQSLKKASEGGWQPEKNDLSGETSVVLEAIRLLASENCSAAHISQGMAEILPQELAGATVDISGLEEIVKSCLSR